MHAALRHRLQPQKIPQIHTKTGEKWGMDAWLVFETQNSINGYL